MVPAIARWRGTEASAHPEVSPVGIQRIWIITQMRGAQLTELNNIYSMTAG
ncbi:MAG: hypothetical protein ACO1NV_07355 [Leptospira bouyouniensis]